MRIDVASVAGWRRWSGASIAQTAGHWNLSAAMVKRYVQFVCRWRGHAEVRDLRHVGIVSARAALAAVLLAVGLAVHAAEPRICLVVGVSDGDTITARCGEPGAYEQLRVRLAGIDAPEKSQPFGQRAKQAMSDFTFGKHARLDCYKTDRYGRGVCNVWVASAPGGPTTLDAGLAMVTRGLAWWYRAYAIEQTPEARGQYEFAEKEAKARRVGLWADAEPVAPWEWRRQRRGGAGQ